MIEKTYNFFVPFVLFVVKKTNTDLAGRYPNMFFCGVFFFALSAFLDLLCFLSNI